MKKREYGKAGELLWGTIAETAKAFHLQYYRMPIDSHNDIRKFLDSLYSIYKKKELREWKRSADNLHVNFYESYLDEPTFMEEYTNGVKLLAFLSGLLRKTRKETKSRHLT